MSLLLWVLMMHKIQEGCFVTLKKELGSQSLVIVSVYTPNKAQGCIWEMVYGKLFEALQLPILMIARFNVVMDN